MIELDIFRSRYLGRADILVIDDDGGDSLETYFESALGGQNWSSDYQDRLTGGDLGSFKMEEYNSVIWFTGNERNSTLTSSG